MSLTCVSVSDNVWSAVLIGLETRKALTEKLSLELGLPRWVLRVRDEDDQS